MKLHSIFLTATTIALVLNSCRFPISATAVQQPQSPQKIGVSLAQVLWSGNFDDANWKQQWQVSSQKDWGWENTTIVPDPSGRFSKVLRVAYPAGSASPEVSRSEGAPLGGCQFLANLGIQPIDKLRLSYFVRFSENFNFVKGGKLPGLFGGTANSGGGIPNGTDGFSTRYMWRRAGAGEVYAYLPTSKESGTSLGRGSWSFKPGVWYFLEQEVILNQPGEKNGRVRVWVDGVQVFEQTKLTFRTTSALKINGLFFSTFFGGSDDSWATPDAVYADFANFSVSTVPALESN